LAVKNPELNQEDRPDNSVNFWLVKLTVLPVLDALPLMLEAVYTHVTVPKSMFRTILSGFVVLACLTVTGKPVESLIVELKGRSPTFTLCFPVFSIAAAQRHVCTSSGNGAGSGAMFVRVRGHV
jgi:hypothetical protein